MTAAKPNDVSPNNPCPFLRALVSIGLLADDRVGLGEIARITQKVARTGDGSPSLPGAIIRGIAMMANGLGVLQLARNVMNGVQIGSLRDGPLDKHGAGSGILDAHANIVEAQLARLDDFAGDKVDADGRVERGLDRSEITRMMDANFDRAKGRRRHIDRYMMDNEWPILLDVMGKEGSNGRYLSLADVRRLFVERRLPERMEARLAKG